MKLKYELARMLKEIAEDERRQAKPKRALSQEQIRALLKQRKKEQK